MKMFSTIALLVTLFYVSVDAQTLSVDVNGFSGTPWRQLAFTAGHTLYLEAGWGNLGVSVFQYTTWKDKNISQLCNDEFDLAGIYNFGIGDIISGKLLYTLYNLPSIKDGRYYSREFGGSIELPLAPLTPTFESYYDYDMFDAWYCGFTLTKPLPWSFETSVTGAINDGQWTVGGERLEGLTLSLARGFELPCSFTGSVKGYAIANNGDQPLYGFVIGLGWSK